MVKLGNIMPYKKHLIEEDDNKEEIPLLRSIFPVIEDYYLGQLHNHLNFKDKQGEGRIEIYQKERLFSGSFSDNGTRAENYGTLKSGAEIYSLPLRSRFLSEKSLLKEENAARHIHKIQNNLTEIDTAKKESQESLPDLNRAVVNEKNIASVVLKRDEKKEGNETMLGVPVITLPNRINKEKNEKSELHERKEQLPLKLQNFSESSKTVERRTNNELVYYFHKWKGINNVHIHWQEKNKDMFFLTTSSKEVFQHLNNPVVALPSKFQIVIERENKEKKGEDMYKKRKPKKSKV